MYKRLKSKLIEKKIDVKKLVSIVVIMSILVAIIQINIIDFHAATELIDWRKNDVMDINLNVINNKAGVDDVFFKMDVEAAGLYTLTYYLEDGRRTTVSFNNSYQKMDIKFKVQEYDTLNPGTPIEKTQDLIDLSYLEIDYTQQVPSWQFIADKEVNATTETLDFSIVRSASARYPGIAFQMDNKKFIAKWDFQANVLYVLFDGYVAGQIMPVKFVNPKAESQTIKVLKGLEDFTVLPTYLIEDPLNPGTNKEVSPIVYPNLSNDKPGNRPGLRYNFKQPKELVEATWAYDYDVTDLKNIRAVFEIDDIGSNAYLDFNMLLYNAGDTRIYEIPSENGIQDYADPLDANAVNYDYNTTTHTYEVIVVGDKSDLADQDKIIEWNEIEPSRIYNTSIGFQFETLMPEYEFSNFVPESNFAYTYLEYQIKRSDQQEAYLQIVPYDVGTQDEIEYIVLYSKIIAPSLDPINDLWLKHYQSDDDTLSTINIPVPFRANSYQDAYQVLVNFSNTQLTSQVLNYRAIDDLNVPPTTPKIQGIENLYVIPPENETSENPTKIQFDLIWKAIENRATDELDAIFEDGDNNLDNNSVFYEVLVNDIPDIKESNPFQVFRVYEVYKDAADGLYKLRIHDGSSAIDKPSASTNYVDGYNDIDELFRMEKIVIYEDELWTPRIDVTYVDDDGKDIYEVDERTSTTYPTSFQTDFEFPGVNYIRIRAITQKDGVFGVSKYSIPVSLSLSMLIYDIPIVDSVTYEPFYSLIETEPKGVVMEWPAVNISTYENNMLTPVDKEVKDTTGQLGLTYSVYISEDKSALLRLKETNDGYTQVAIDAGGDVSIDGTTLQLLRNEDEDGYGNIVYFDVKRDPDSTANVSTRIEGLDLNKTYYSRIVVTVDVKDTLENTFEQRRGKPSSVISITTPIVPPEPGDDEIVPLAPENFSVEFYDDKQLTASLDWTIPDEITIDLDTYGFEVLGVEDLRMPNELASKEIDLLDILNSETMQDREVEAWRIFYEGTDVVLKKYDKTTSTWVNQNLDLLQVSDQAVRLLDDTNSPNRVNYYYVRTINIKNGVEMNASSWVQDSLTTAPVKGPINLIVDYNSTYTYNGKYETVIRFDAPIPTNADLQNEYRMEVFIKGEDDIDYIQATQITSPTSKNDTFYSQFLGQTEGPIGYERIYYRISGLKAGKQYYIKVRVEDRTKLQETLPDGSTSYPKSPFSERIATRTDFSQEDYDKEVKYKQYIDYYLKKAEAIKQQPYFTLKTDDKVTVLKYRRDYVDGFLQLNKNGEYHLVAKDKETVVYYLPAEMIETANDLNLSYIIEPYGQKIAMKPYSMGSVITKEINQVIDRIYDYNASLEDYYIQIQLTVGDYQTTIFNQKPSSKLVNIQMNIVGSKEVEDNIDIYLEDEINNAITRGKVDLIELLESELDLGINDIKLTQIVQTVIQDVEKDFNSMGQVMFTSYLDSKSYPILSLSKPLTIGISPINSVGNDAIYLKTTGDWKVATAQYYDNRYHITSKDLGSFIGVNPIGTTNLTSLYSPEQLDVINKYRLSEVFTSSELKNPTANIKNIQLIQTYARLLGANADTDTSAYLTKLGISSPYLSDFNLTSKEVANYLYVQVYTKKKQMNLNAVLIRDFNAIEDISLVAETYRNTLLKGVSLGIIPLQQKQLNPKANVTLNEFMAIIDSIE